MYSFIKHKIRLSIFIINFLIIFLLTSISKSISEENVFVVDNINIKGNFDTNHSREKYINQAFFDSFQMLISKILLSRDLSSFENLKLNKIKELINSFQIIEERYEKNIYEAKFKVFYNEKRVKKLLIKRNISFSQPKNISAVFFPVLFINGEIKSLSENYFYKEWNNIKIKNELINFILPLEDLDDILKIKSSKDNVEELDINYFTKKYDTDNFAFALMEYNNNNLSIYVKSNFEGNKMSKNYLYKIQNITNSDKLDVILKDLKMQITDIWKELNILNLLMPLSIKIKFQHKNLDDLDNLKNKLQKISIIDKSSLDELSTNYSVFKIYYYGNPKKLKSELFNFGYQLRNEKGYWEVFAND